MSLSASPIRPQFNNPTTDVSNANYGYITGAGGGRGMQLGAKISF